MGSFLVCAVSYIAYKKVKKLTSGRDRKETSSEEEQIEMCAEPLSQDSSPVTIKRIKYGIIGGITEGRMTMHVG